MYDMRKQEDKCTNVLPHSTLGEPSNSVGALCSRFATDASAVNE